MKTALLILFLLTTIASAQLAPKVNAILFQESGTTTLTLTGSNGSLYNNGSLVTGGSGGTDISHGGTVSAGTLSASGTGQIIATSLAGLGGAITSGSYYNFASGVYQSGTNITLNLSTLGDRATTIGFGDDLAYSAIEVYLSGTNYAFEMYDTAGSTIVSDGTGNIEVIPVGGNFTMHNPVVSDTNNLLSVLRLTGSAASGSSAGGASFAIGSDNDPYHTVSSFGTNMRITNLGPIGIDTSADSAGITFEKDYFDGTKMQNELYFSNSGDERPIAIGYSVSHFAPITITSGTITMDMSSGDEALTAFLTHPDHLFRFTALSGTSGTALTVGGTTSWSTAGTAPYYYLKATTGTNKFTFSSTQGGGAISSTATSGTMQIGGFGVGTVTVPILISADQGQVLGAPYQLIITNGISGDTTGNTTAAMMIFNAQSNGASYNGKARLNDESIALGNPAYGGFAWVIRHDPFEEGKNTLMFQNQITQDYPMQMTGSNGVALGYPIGVEGYATHANIGDTDMYGIVRLTGTTTGLSTTTAPGFTTISGTLCIIQSGTTYKFNPGTGVFAP